MYSLSSPDSLKIINNSYDDVVVLPDGKETRLCANISQVSAVEAITIQKMLMYSLKILFVLCV